jgi:hypothetical protein
MSAAARPWRVAVAIAALAIAWRVLVVNGVLYDLNGRAHLPAPRMGGSSPGESPSARQLLSEALRGNPAEVAALLMWAGEAREESAERAELAYRAAVDLAPADRDVLNAAAAFYLERGRVPEAVDLLERLADHYPDTREQVFPLLAGYFFSANGAAAWSDVAARNPPWVAPFIVASCRHGLDPSVLAALLVKRMAAGAAAQGEVACVVERLRIAGRWSEAYQLWLNSLPRGELADVGFVFNGGFETAPAPTGFDWMLASQPERETGYAAEIVRTPGASARRSLRVAYTGKRQSGVPAAQYLAVPAGNYAFAGMARIERMTLGRGVHWTIRCIAEGRPGAVIARSERFIGSSDWQPFGFEVTIPEGCDGQILQLEPVGPEGSVAFAGGTVWFDDLVLRRVP